jgi:hypothetical protein
VVPSLLPRHKLNADFLSVRENHFYGTPLNPKAPDRIPCGSSSGSVSALACGLVDFALGTDTGGSIRVPANNCGIWGMRPSHGYISVAGVNPLAPTFESVATRGGVLRQRTGRLVIAGPQGSRCFPPESDKEGGRVYAGMSVARLPPNDASD